MDHVIKKYIRFRYSEKDLEDACRDIASGTLSLNAAHKNYNIPKSTLHNKVNQKVPMQRKLGPFTQLTQAEEDALAEWVIKKAKSGFPMHPDELQLTVKKYLDANDRRSTFINNKPGRKWLQLFLRRHPEISKRNAEVISRARASVTEVSIRKWFEELNNFLKENEAEDIMEHPERIFNADETGVQMCPKSGAVLAPKNFKNSYQIAPGKEKEQVTVLCNVSAKGDSAPPMLVYPYKRIPRSIVETVPGEWGIGRSDSGWMISETFLDYVKNIFYPWLIQNNIAFPVIMFLDGHKSHINKELFEYCTKNKILLFCLFPNATHILQPCDVSFFKSLKNAWRDAVRNFKAENPMKVLNRCNFAEVFEIAYNNTISKTDVISNGFRKCGLFPLDPNSVDYTKCVTSHQVAGEQVTGTFANDADVQTVQHDTLSTISHLDVQSTLKVIKHLTTDSVIEEFNASRDENISHHHPYFPLWLFCKTFLSSKDITVPLTEARQSKDHNDGLSETGINYELNFVEFDDPMNKNTTGLDLEAILNDENLIFEYREDNLVNNMPMQKIDATIIESCENRSLARSPDNDSDVTNASSELLLTEILENDMAVPNTDAAISKYRDEISVNGISENDVSMLKPHTNKDSSELGIREEDRSKTTNKTTQGIEEFLTIPNLNKTTQKRKTTIMPYGITCSKMKDYFNEQDLKKKEKEEDIQRKKAIRLEKALKKDAKGTVLRKKNRQLKKPKEDIILTDEDTKENEENKSITLKNDDIDIETSVESRKKRTNDENDLLVETKRMKSEENSTHFRSESMVKFADISINSYILVKFEQPKSTKLFAGKVLVLNDDGKKIKVDFLRKKRQKNTECELFVYPQVKDVYEVDVETVVEILLVKNTTRRGEIIFTKDLKKLNVI